MNKYAIYIRERFPLVSHVPLISVFTFSAVCYSLAAVGSDSFIPWPRFVATCFFTFTTFFLLRISDEFKDYEDDMKYRKYLPVPRGVISLNDLKYLGFGVLALQLLVVFIYPAFAKMYLVVMVFLFLMYHEFFIAGWLKKNQAAYVFSHMLIIPLVDLLASSGHWSFENISPPHALLWFFILSFFNGIVLEIGRKIKMPENEEEGVVSYTKLYGLRGAVWVWLVLVLITFACAWVAMQLIDTPTWAYIVMSCFAVIALLSALFFIKKPTKGKAKFIEVASGIWSIGMYLNVGALPFIFKNLV